MAKTFEAITPEMGDWIGRQQLFFVATAPSGVDGHVNVSPKGPIESGVLDFPDLGELPQQQRSVIRVDVDRIATACGFGVPLMDFAGTRNNARRWAEGRLAKDGPDALEAYKAEKNTASIDGLPAIA